MNAPPEEETAPAARQSFWKRFSTSLEAGRRAYVAELRGLFGRPALDPAFWNDLEAILLEADVGAGTSTRLVGELQARAARGDLRGPDDALAALKRALSQQLQGRPRQLNLTGNPAVILVVGVNGSGKTTTIGKLAHRLRSDGRRPLLAAADTYRPAAIDQLRLWAQRAGAGFVAHQPGADPGAVAFDAVDAARARGSDIVLVDTAGRLHTRHDLIEELKKVRRVLARHDAAPHEVVAVLDAHVGQNSAQQARVFHEELGLTGLAVTKMDGSARAGILLRVEEELGVPTKLVGIGEGLDDLDFFDAARYVEALLRVEGG